MVTIDRWRRIQDLCHAALERDARKDRFLADACGGDAGSVEVESLLARADRIDVA